MLKTTKQIVFIALALVVIVAFGLACCGAAEGPSATAPTDKAFKMNKLLGRGVSLGNALDAPSEGEWGVVLKEEYFELIKQAGFDSVRLPVRWSAHALKEKPYTIDPKLFKRVDWAINCALSRKLPVMLNVHHYDELYSNPAGQKDRFLALWRQIAEHYRNYPDTLMFELLNEPQDRIKPSTWNPFLKQPLAVVRQSNPNRTVVIGPADYSHIEALEYLNIPKEDRNIIVTIHYYSPYEFTHQGAPWVTTLDASSWVGKKWTGSDAEKQTVIKDFDIVSEWAKQNNRPINIGEFGTYERADMDSRACWTKFVADAAVQRGFSFAYWQFTSNFALYDTEKKTWVKPILDAVIPPKP